MAGCLLLACGVTLLLLMAARRNDAYDDVPAQYFT